jgi:hypothetical protein
VAIACEGAPRDLGLDQGRAIGEGVDAELARILRERPGGGGFRTLGRDVQRHFPHLAERMAGLARGATVGYEALVVALVRASREPGFLFRPARAVAAAAPDRRHALLGGRFDLSADRCSVPVVRRSEPQGGFASLELTLPWLASSLGGVNAAGFAALLAPPDLPRLPGEERRAEAACRAPAMLFVQQCLERFDRVDTALEWCLSRPSDGSAAILFADVTGALAGVALDGDRRFLVALGPSAAGEGEASSSLGRGAAVLPALLAAGGDATADALAHRAYLWLDPASRTLEVVSDQDGLAPAGLVERFTLDPTEG